MKFRIEVQTVDYKKILNANIDSLADYSGSEEEIENLSKEIERLAATLVNNNHIMIVELDIENKTAIVIPSIEAHSNDYLIGIQ